MSVPLRCWPLVALGLPALAPLALPAALPLVALVPAAPALAAQPRSQELEVRVLLAEGSSLPLAALRQPLRIEPAGVLLPPGSQATVVWEQGRVRLQQTDARGGRSSQVLPAAASYWLTAVPGAAAPNPNPVDPGAAPEGAFQLQQRRYRGRLQLLPAAGQLRAINHVPLESYLPSVVGSEMPASWPQAALRAQAVAARTYALRQRRPGEAFDLQATVMSQVYKGLEAETASTREAVAATRGQVLMHGPNLINAVFHSSSGGRTENSGDIWRQQLPYLVSVPDYDQGSPVHSWEQRFEPEQLRELFAEIGGLTRIDVLSTTATGRVREARVVGPAGTRVLTGPELRSRLRLRSTQVRFTVVEPELALGLPPLPPLPPLPGALPAVPTRSPQLAPAPLRVPQPSLLVVGRGFGHGVGMSQWGALAMAQRGDSYEQILQHYYRGTALRTYPGRP